MLQVGDPRVPLLLQRQQPQPKACTTFLTVRYAALVPWQSLILIYATATLRRRGALTRWLPAVRLGVHLRQPRFHWRRGSFLRT